jgi:hypothetical protein
MIIYQELCEALGVGVRGVDDLSVDEVMVELCAVIDRRLEQFEKRKSLTLAFQPQDL